MTYFISASLFASPPLPSTGLFVMHRLNALKKHLMLSYEDLFIASPTPYFPFKNNIFKHYANYAKKPHSIINYHDFQICYPRYLQIPFSNHQFSGYFTYLSLKKYFEYYCQKNGLPKKLIAEYGFPDAVAIHHLSVKYNIPYIVTLRGSDISYFLTLKQLTPQIMSALLSAQSIICVSHNMKEGLHKKYAVPLEKMHVVGNGVDHKIFSYQPTINQKIRNTYNITTPYIICSVGGLIPRKNHALAVSALQYLPNHSLVIAGEGSEQHYLKELAQKLSVKNRVFLIGSQSQTELAHLYNEANLFVLCSQSEGRPNVVLEALKCGTAVLTTHVNGVDELITQKTFGEIVDKNISAQELAYKINYMSLKEYIPHDIQAHASKFSWEKSAIEYANILTK